MSWLRLAVSKAVEVGNNNNLTRVVKNYADTVVHHAGQAVAEGAKILQDRIGARNLRSIRQTIQRLEEASVSCGRPERAQLLRSWLVVLKEVKNLSDVPSEETAKTLEQHLAFEDAKESPRKPDIVLYYEPDVGGEPMNFYDVFLHSQALEGITLSMILEAPDEEEVSLLLDMFGLCLIGGKEVHNAIVSSIQDLAKSFSSYEDEVLVKREELLQFAQSAISGLKINADLGRVDTELSNLKTKLEGMSASSMSSNADYGNTSEETTLETIEALKAALSHIRICSRVDELLMKKKFLNNGDSPEIHAQKIDKLKVLSESLSNSCVKAEKHITDHRLQKEEALNVRLTKATETGEKEKELTTEIAELERQRDDIEAQLKKVNISLAAAHARLRNMVEERDQFEEANNKIVAHLKTREDELLKSISSCKAESNVLTMWINFLEDTWNIQCLHRENKEKEVNDALEKHEGYFVNLAIDLLSAYKKELEPSISRIEKFVENLKNLRQRSEESILENDESKVLSPTNNLEREYLGYEAKIITTFSVVDHMKEQFLAQQAQVSRKDDSRVQELFDDIEKLRQSFDSIERPNLEIETPPPRAENESREEAQSSVPQPSAEDSENSKVETGKQLEVLPAVNAEQTVDAAAELAKLESEFGKVSLDYSTGVLRLQRPVLLPVRLQRAATPQNTLHIRSFSSVPRGFSSALHFGTIQPPNGHIEPKDFHFKVALVVNTASKCTHAGQLKQLQTLHEKYSEKGLIVVAVPSNDFARQEPGDSDDVLKRYADFGVTFAIANKTPVTGTDAHPFFKRIADKYSTSVAPTWNFDKFLVDHRGDMRAVFPNDTEPLVKEVIVEIEEALEDATEALERGQELLEDEEDSDDEDNDGEESDDEDDDDDGRYK